MKWTIDYISNGNYFRVTDAGIYEKGDTEDIYRELFSHPSWKPGSAVLRDLRLLDFKYITYHVMSKAVAAVVRKESSFGSARIAYLVDSDVGFGVCRQIQMLMEANSSLNIKIFRDDEAAAIKWLTKRRPVSAERRTTNPF